MRLAFLLLLQAIKYRMSIDKEITRRRTFAIISHPDAGKTTLTEKLLLYGGAIQVAGAVKLNKIKKKYYPDPFLNYHLSKPVLFYHCNLIFLYSFSPEIPVRGH